MTTFSKLRQANDAAGSLYDLLDASATPGDAHSSDTTAATTATTPGGNDGDDDAVPRLTGDIVFHDVDFHYNSRPDVRALTHSPCVCRVGPARCGCACVAFCSMACGSAMSKRSVGHGAHTAETRHFRRTARAVAAAVVARDLVFAARVDSTPPLSPLLIQTPVLSKLCMTVAEGKTTVLVGPSGIGKSTVVALLTRLHHPRVSAYSYE